MASRNNKRPGTGKYAVEFLDLGPPPHPHSDRYGLGSCTCAMCSEWYLRLIRHDRAKKSGQTPEIRRTLVELMVVENIRDIWSELSWAAQMEHWPDEWMEWAMSEFADPDRSVGWWGSQAAHHPMRFWYIRWACWRTRLLARRQSPITLFPKGTNTPCSSATSTDEK